MITTTGKTIDALSETGLRKLLLTPSIKAKISATLFAVLVEIVTPKIALAQLRVGQQNVTTTSPMPSSNQVAVLPPVEQKVTVESPKLSLKDRLKATGNQLREETARLAQENARLADAENQRLIHMAGTRALNSSATRGPNGELILEISDLNKREAIRIAIFSIIDEGIKYSANPDIIDGLGALISIAQMKGIIDEEIAEHAQTSLRRSSTIAVGELPTK